MSSFFFEKTTHNGLVHPDFHVLEIFKLAFSSKKRAKGSLQSNKMQAHEAILIAAKPNKSREKNIRTAMKHLQYQATNDA